MSMGLRLTSLLTKRYRGDCSEGYIRMTGWLNEEETTMDTGVLDVTFSLGGKFFPQVCGMLIFDVLDNRVPAIQRVSLLISQAINSEWK